MKCVQNVTDMVDYNLEMINPHALHSSFFHLSRHDPTIGFEFDGRSIPGYTIPANSSASPGAPLLRSPGSMSSADGGHSTLYMRLLIGSHLAQHLRRQLEEHQGYTSTVGISTSKLISKLVGNVNKPMGQTTLLPPYLSFDANESNVIQFLDGHDIGKIPGIGFKSAQRIRDHVLGRPAAFDAELVYGDTKERVTVRHVRLSASMGVGLLEKLLGGPGAPKDIGSKVWTLINGVDDSEVSKAREEDSYIKLDTMAAVYKELCMLSRSLLSRIREDLLCVDNDNEAPVEDAGGEDERKGTPSPRQWLACPRTLRLTTRPRPPLNPDGTRSRSFSRISRSCDMPSLVLNLSQSIEDLSERLVQGTLIPLFHKLHPEKSGWNLSLMNLCATNMSLTAASARDSAGQDISKMFRRQEDFLKDWKVEDDTDDPTVFNGFKTWDKHDHDSVDATADASTSCVVDLSRADDFQQVIDHCGDDEDIWQSDEELLGFDRICTTCGLSVPHFAMDAHDRFHKIPD
ncbi:MAG: hypothetical protein Q9225_005954 [Loekoesia sp. 1 TL-2023]